MSSAFDTIRGVLDRHGHLEESLLLELRLVDHGYTVELDFDPWPNDLRSANSEPTESRPTVTLRLMGVASLELVGGLTDVMLAHPEGINWGLSEVAIVEVKDTNHGPCLRVLWEGERRVVIYFQSAEVIE